MDAEFDRKFESLRDAHNKGVIVGLHEVAGLAPRLDIDVLMEKNPKAFNLFLIAFEQLQQVPSSDIMGFFQIAGIHGFPSQDWYEIPGRQREAGDPGYCAHSKTTFPTWHRPYLAMLEQALFVKMMEHANKYNEPHRTEYRKAVYDFRLPYWDYHRPRGGKVEFPGVILDGKRTNYKYNFCVPLIFTAPTVVVLDEPDNLPRTLERNPLNFHAFDATAGQLNEENEWKKIYSEETGVSRNRTSRHPMPESLDNPDRLNSVVNEIRMDSARLAVRLVTDPEYGNYEIISKSTAARGNVQAPASSPDDPRKTEEQKQLEGKVKPFSGSLEGIHNMYHVYLGGFGSASGHIGYVPVAAFDPIFWFHHNNIERMFTIWQAVHADKETNWFNYDPQEAKEALRPFLRREKPSGGVTDDDFWSSDDVRDSRTLGYYFEDTGDANGNFPGQKVAANYAANYNWSIPTDPHEDVGEPPEAMKPIAVEDKSFFKNQPVQVLPAPIPEIGPVQSSTAPASAPVSEPGSAPAPVPASAPEAAPEPATEPATEPVPEPAAASVPASIPASVQAAETKSTNQVLWEWYIDDRVEAMTLNDSFTIPYFVLSKPSATLAGLRDLAVAPTLVGATHIFTAPKETCGNCAAKARDRTVVRNTMIITSQLMDYVKVGELGSLDPVHVVPFLTARLRWRVVTAGGVQIDPRRLRNDGSLKISISSRRSTVGADASEEPLYANYPRVVADIVAAASAQATFVQQT